MLHININLPPPCPSPASGGGDDVALSILIGRPIFPGVIQLEALAQTGAIALLADPRYAGKLPLFGGVEEVRFRRQVVPGDELALAVDLERLSSRGGWGRATATVDGKTSCSGRLFFVLAPEG